MFAKVKISESFKLLGFAVCFVLTSHSTSFAQELRELSFQSGWKKVVSRSNSCAFKSPTIEGYEFVLQRNTVEDHLMLDIFSSFSEYSTGNTYQVDITFNKNLVFQTTGIALSGHKLQVFIGDNTTLLTELQNNDETLIGYDGTLYVIDTAEHGFPIAMIEDCVRNRSKGLSNDNVVSRLFSDLNPFVQQDDDYELEIASNDRVDTTDKRKSLNKASSGLTINALPLSEKRKMDQALNPPKSYNTPFYAEPDDFGDAYLVEREDLSSDHKVAPAENVIAKTLKDEIDPYALHAARISSDAEPVIEPVFDIVNIPENQYPSELYDIKGHVTAKSNHNEDQAELIESLLVQLALLEKEKEALRKKVIEQPSQVGVIRSCTNEKTAIADLQDEVQILQTETFDYKRQQEIQKDILESCVVAQDEDFRGELKDIDINDANDLVGDEGNNVFAGEYEASEEVLEEGMAE